MFALTYSQLTGIQKEIAVNTAIDQIRTAVTMGVVLAAKPLSEKELMALALEGAKSVKYDSNGRMIVGSI